ncbi:MAG: type II secretion system protein [Pseudomonadota bacterium]
MPPYLFIYMATAFFTTSANAVAHSGFGRRRRTGFTLVELVISIAIFSIITGIMVWNFDRYNQNDNLRRGTEQLAADLRLVQNMAMTGATTKGTGAGETTATIPIGGYGLHIDRTNAPDQYRLFADRESYDGNDCPDPPVRNGRLDRDFFPEGLVPLCLHDDTADDLYIAPASMLPKDVIVDSISIAKVPPVPADILDIAFQPPKPIPSVGYGQLSNPAEAGRTVSITLKHVKTNAARTITLIGASGQISITSS